MYDSHIVDFLAIQGSLTEEFTKGSMNLFTVDPRELCTRFMFLITPNEADFELSNNGPSFPQLSPRPIVSYLSRSYVTFISIGGVVGCAGLGIISIEVFSFFGDIRPCSLL